MPSRQRAFATWAAKILELADDAIVCVDETDRVLFFNRAGEAMFGCRAEEVLGRRIGVLMPRHSRQVYRECVRALAPGEDIRWEGTARRKGGGEFPLEATLSCQDVDGRPVLIIGARDISERQRARDADELLLREMEHRVKNLLASVQALARQTLCASPSPEIFAGSFIERLAALSRVHALLIRSRWRGAALHDLVGAELSPYRSEERGDAAIKGDAVFLNPEPALALSLVLHELATNAAKYGALSMPEGRVEVSWRLEDRGVEQHLMLHWAELGGPRYRSRSGGASEVRCSSRESYSRSAGQSISGSHRRGVRCRIELPIDANPEGQP